MLTARITGAVKGLRLPIPVVQRDTAQRGIIGCNLAVWREDLLAINGFDEEYLPVGALARIPTWARALPLGRPRKFVYAHAIVFHLNHPVRPETMWPAAWPASRNHSLRQGRCAAGLTSICNPMNPHASEGEAHSGKFFGRNPEGFFVEVGAKRSAQRLANVASGATGLARRPGRTSFSFLRNAQGRAPASRVVQVACGAPGHPATANLFVGENSEHSSLQPNLVMATLVMCK